MVTKTAAQIRPSSVSTKTLVLSWYGSKPATLVCSIEIIIKTTLKLPCRAIKNPRPRVTKLTHRGEGSFHAVPPMFSLPSHRLDRLLILSVTGATRALLLRPTAYHVTVGRDAH